MRAISTAEHKTLTKAGRLTAASSHSLEQDDVLLRLGLDEQFVREVSLQAHIEACSPTELVRQALEAYLERTKAARRAWLVDNEEQGSSNRNRIVVTAAGAG